MEPSLKNGDIVFYKQYFANKSTIELGQIVIFNHPFRNIKLIKRVKTINEFSVEVSGDNKENSTDSESFGFIQKSKVSGIVTSSINSKTFKILKIFSTFK